MAVLERSRTAVGQNYCKATYKPPVIRIYLLFLDFACQKVGIKWSHRFLFKSVGLKLR